VQTALVVYEGKVVAAVEDVENLERELRSKRAQIKALRRDQDQRMKTDPQHDNAMEVLEHWRTLCAPKTRELGGKRLENVIARLHGGYSVTELKQAASGYASRPFVSNGKRVADGRKENWYADAELVFRDAQKVDAGIRMATAPVTKRSVSLSIVEAREWVLDCLDRLYPGASLHDKAMEWWVAPCPVCLGGGLPLRVLDRNTKPWLFCSVCNADGPRIAEALRGGER